MFVLGLGVEKIHCLVGLVFEFLEKKCCRSLSGVYSAMERFENMKHLRGTSLKVKYNWNYKNLEMHSEYFKEIARKIFCVPFSTSFHTHINKNPPNLKFNYSHSVKQHNSHSSQQWLSVTIFHSEAFTVHYRCTTDVAAICQFACGACRNVHELGIGSEIRLALDDLHAISYGRDKIFVERKDFCCARHFLQHSLA